MFVYKDDDLLKLQSDCHELIAMLVSTIKKTRTVKPNF